MGPEAGGGLRDLLFLHELLFLPLCFPLPPPHPKLLIFLPFLLYEASLGRVSAQLMDAEFVVDLDCNVDSQTINSTAPCSSRSSIAATLPMS